MLNRRFLAASLLSAVAWAADQRVPVPAGGQAEVRVLLSSAELQTDQALWVQADPKQIEVTVIGPDGRRWAQANSREGSLVEIYLADRESGSSNEVYLADFLGSNGTLVKWSKSAAAGTHRVNLSGKNLAASAEVFLRKVTMDELMQRRKTAVEESLASMLAVPERRIPLDAQGKASTIVDPVGWDKGDVVIAGTTLSKKFSASLKMPDGTTITEANAAQTGCQWQLGEGMLQAFLKVGPPHLTVTCPKRMQGAVSIGIDAGPQSTGAEMAVAVLSAKNLASAFAEGEERDASLSRTVRLRHKVNSKDQQEGFADAVVGRVTAIRVMPVEGSDRIASITAKAESFEIDSKKYRGYMIVGPDPSKISLGAARAAAREADGGFIYSFVARRLGIFQVDFTAEGLFANGRRFSATYGIRIFVRE